MASDRPVPLERLAVVGIAPDGAAAALRTLAPFLDEGPAQFPKHLQLRLRIDANHSRPQGYALHIAITGVDLIAHDAAGLFYGAQTLAQLLKLNPRQLPFVSIVDYPDFPVRGVMLDVSRDKVPTMDTLRKLIDLLASWKINQLQLYIEHTFAYASHREVWEHASPFTAEEIRELDAYCRDRLIDLVPNQNSFGHMERWLKHEKYLPLAEAPEGAQTPWGFRWKGPFSLCPTDPKSLELLKELYAELLPNFSSKLFNVGCDETFDLGQGRSKAAVEQRGVEHVYLDFLLQVYELVRQHGKTMQYWGDIIMKHPQLIPELPKDAIALEWGYEAGHPFDADGEKFAAAGVPFYVCPGTSSWCSITGRTDNAIANLRNAAAAGLKHGAIGYLNTDWGDHGHLQYLPISYLPFAAGAALSWCEESNRKSDFTQAVSRFAFNDFTGKMGCLAYDFGNLYLLSTNNGSNGSAVFRLLVPPMTGKVEVAKEELDRTEARIDELLSSLEQTEMTGPDAELIAAEYRNAAVMLRLACQLGRGEKPSADGVRAMIAEHRRLWLARNRPGGLDDSAARLEAVLKST
jgi:hypothetical protein